MQPATAVFFKHYCISNYLDIGEGLLREKSISGYWQMIFRPYPQPLRFIWHQNKSNSTWLQTKRESVYIIQIWSRHHDSETNFSKQNNQTFIYELSYLFIHSILKHVTKNMLDIYLHFFSAEHCVLLTHKKTKHIRNKRSVFPVQNNCSHRLFWGKVTRRPLLVMLNTLNSASIIMSSAQCTRREILLNQPEIRSY